VFEKTKLIIPDNNIYQQAVAHLTCWAVILLHVCVFTYYQMKLAWVTRNANKSDVVDVPLNVSHITSQTNLLSQSIAIKMANNLCKVIFTTTKRAAVQSTTTQTQDWCTHCYTLIVHILLQLIQHKHSHSCRHNISLSKYNVIIQPLLRRQWTK